MTQKEFFELQDEDLKTYLYMTDNIQKSIFEEGHVNTEEKEGYYRFVKTIKHNQKGKFYLSSRLDEWAVYNKKTKKTSLSTNHAYVRKMIIEDKFRYPDLVAKYIPRLTKVICKKIMTGKISTLRHIIDYHRIYTYRRKDITTENMYKIISYGIPVIMDIIEDVNSICLEDVEIDKIAYSAKLIPLKFKTLDYEEINSGCKNWWDQQKNKKHASIQVPGDGLFGIDDIESNACKVLNNIP